MDTCSVFVYKDLKTILSNPDLLSPRALNELRDGESLVINKGTNQLPTLPIELCHMTQSSAAIKKIGLLDIKIENELLEHYKAKKNKYGLNEVIEVSTKGNKFFREKSIVNKLSTYFKNKYLQKTLPEMIDQLTNEKIINILETYDFDQIQPPLIGEEGIEHTEIL